MGRLSILAKKLLDRDTRALVKSGYLDNTLNVTDDGLEFLSSYLFDLHKKELAELAKKELKSKRRTRRIRREDEEDCDDECREDDCDGDDCDVDEETSKKKKGR